MRYLKLREFYSPNKIKFSESNETGFEVYFPSIDRKNLKEFVFECIVLSETQNPF